MVERRAKLSTSEEAARGSAPSSLPPFLPSYWLCVRYFKQLHFKRADYEKLPLACS
jgi:hypothetical protein